jgi:hypothetical protein
MRQSLIGHTIGLSDTEWVGLCCAPLMLLFMLLFILLLPLLSLSVLTCADAIIDEPHMRGTYEHMSHHRVLLYETMPNSMRNQFQQHFNCQTNYLLDL